MKTKKLKKYILEYTGWLSGGTESRDVAQEQQQLQWANKGKLLNRLAELQSVLLEQGVEIVVRSSKSSSRLSGALGQNEVMVMVHRKEGLVPYWPIGGVQSKEFRFFVSQSGYSIKIGDEPRASIHLRPDQLEKWLWNNLIIEDGKMKKKSIRETRWGRKGARDTMMRNIRSGQVGSEMVDYEDKLQDKYGEYLDELDVGWDEEEGEWMVLEDNYEGGWVRSGVTEPGPIGKMKAWDIINGQEERQFRSGQMADQAYMGENTMRLTKKQLKRIIREEYRRILKEQVEIADGPDWYQLGIEAYDPSRSAEEALDFFLEGEQFENVNWEDWSAGYEEAAEMIRSSWSEGI